VQTGADSLERAELYLRTRAERLLDPQLSAWREIGSRSVPHLVAVAEALVALGVIDNTTFSSVLDDLELAGWLRQRMLGDVARTRAVLAEAFAPVRQGWPPTLLACPAMLEGADGALLQLLWLVRRPGAPTLARMQSSGIELADVVVVDDRGGSYRLEAAKEVGLARVIPDPPSTIRGLELRAGERAALAGVAPPEEVTVGRRAHETMSPQQIYLANLLGLLPHGRAAMSAERVAGVAAAVAEALVDLRLIEPDDDLVRRAQTAEEPKKDATAGGVDGGHVLGRAIGRELGLQGVSVFLEGYVRSGERIIFHLQLAEGPRRVTGGFAGPPWFGLIDETGRTYDLLVRSENGHRVEVLLEGGLAGGTGAARFFVDTPFESAWIDLDAVTKS
jgi:hypothetical protein